MIRLLNGNVRHEQDGQTVIEGLGGKFEVGSNIPATIQLTSMIK